MPGGGGANNGAVTGTVNILEGGGIIMDDANTNSPSSGVFNIAGAAGTTIKDPFNNTLDMNGDGIIDAGDTSIGPGAIYTNQTTTVLANGATWNVGQGFLLVLDNDNAINGWDANIVNKADYILDDADGDSFG